MSEINYQALREAAEAIKIAATPQKLLAFRMKVTPQVVLALLDEREAQNKRIAELEANFAALAVENVRLNKFIKDDCFIYTGDDISPRDANGFKPETPATDAFWLIYRRWRLTNFARRLSGTQKLQYWMMPIP